MNSCMYPSKAYHSVSVSVRVCVCVQRAKVLATALLLVGCLRTHGTENPKCENTFLTLSLET